MKLLFKFTLIFCTLIAYGQQNFSSETYTVRRPDLIINTFASDSTANAITIYEYGNTYVNDETFKIDHEYKQKLKILNNKGFDNATVKIYLYNNKRSKVKLSKLKATTYNLEDNNITTTKLEKKHIYEKRINDNYTEVSFTFPNVKPGSVLTYSYKLTDPFPFNYIPWSFQSHIPTLYSEYNTSIPGNYEYHIKLVGGKKLSVNESKLKSHCLIANGAYASCAVSKYVMKDIPAFKEEDFMTAKDNYIAHIGYELKTFNGFDGTVKHYTKSWDYVDKEIKSDKDIGKLLNKSNLGKSIPDLVINTSDNKLSIAKSIVHFISTNFKWNGKYNLFKDKSLKRLIKERTGSAAEINILLHNLLKEYDLEVYPVLISTRKNGFATRVYPVISDFNYLITQAKINGETYLLDATSPYLNFGQIPYKTLNQYGRLLNFKGNSEWIDITVDKNSATQHLSTITVTSDSIYGDIKSRYTGYNALNKKTNYFTNKVEYFKNTKSEVENFDVKEHKVLTSSIDDIHFEETKTIVTDQIDVIGNKIYLKPIIEKLFTENPFKLQHRTYPIDFGYKDSYAYSTKINFDDSYSIENLPEKRVIRLEDNSASLTFDVKTIGDSINLTLRITFSKPIYSSSYYESLKKIVNVLIDIQNNSLVVLAKK